MGLFNLVKDYASDPSRPDRALPSVFLDAYVMRGFVTRSLELMARPLFGKQCSITAAQVLERHRTDHFHPDLGQVLHAAIFRAIGPQYFEVYTEDQRRWLEDTARRWSDKELIEEEFSFLRMRGEWLIHLFVKDKYDFDFEAIRIGMKRWMVEQNDRLCRRSNGCKLGGSNGGPGMIGVFKVKTM
jgi:hypothetical protein